MRIPYLREAGLVIGLIALIVSHGMAYRIGDRLARGKQDRTALAAVVAADKRAGDAEDRLAKALAKLPETGKKVSDAVQANPTRADCVVPDAVVDSLQDGIDSGRAATR